MELLEFLELILGTGTIPIGIIGILRINSRILKIPKIPEKELPGNAGQARISQKNLRIGIIQIGINRILRINSRNWNCQKMLARQGFSILLTIGIIPIGIIRIRIIPIGIIRILRIN